MIKKFKYLHPFFIALAPAIFLWSNNFSGIFLREVFPALAIIIIFAAIVLCVFLLLYRKLRKAAILASVTLFFVFAYQYIFFNDALISQQMRYQYTFLIILIVIAGVGYAVKKTKKDLVVVNQIITVISGIFILISLLQLGWGFYINRGQTVPAVESVENNQSNSLRDVYYIILDGYSAPWVLRDVMGLEAIDQTVVFLEKQGFFVAKSSLSNYPATDLSLPSSLNLRYLDESENPKIWHKITEDHFLKDFFKSNGYKYFHFGSGTALTYFNRYADQNINMGIFSPYQMAVWETTAFVPIEQFLGGKGIVGDKIGFLDRRITQWKRVPFQLEQLAKLSEKEDGPIFAFAHFLIPKGDSVFDAEGNFLSDEEVAQKNQVEIYLGQVAYINKQIETLMTTILGEHEKSFKPEPIIIIQGDHGFRFSDPNDPGLSASIPIEAELMKNLIIPGNYGYSFPIFNAYYFPDGAEKLLYDSITPINSFRILLNYYFNQKFELLEDKSYIMHQDGFPGSSPYNNDQKNP